MWVPHENVLLDLDDLADGLGVVEGAVLVRQSTALLDRDANAGDRDRGVEDSVRVDDGVGGGDEREREREEGCLAEHD